MGPGIPDPLSFLQLVYRCLPKDGLAWHRDAYTGPSHFQGLLRWGTHHQGMPVQGKIYLFLFIFLKKSFFFIPQHSQSHNMVSGKTESPATSQTSRLCVTPGYPARDQHSQGLARGLLHQKSPATVGREVESSPPPRNTGTIRQLAPLICWAHPSKRWGEAPESGVLSQKKLGPGPVVQSYLVQVRSWGCSRAGSGLTLISECRIFTIDC
jgi:hypothetical protein